MYLSYFFFFFFNDTATTEIYTLSLHDALPIWSPSRYTGRAPERRPRAGSSRNRRRSTRPRFRGRTRGTRSRAARRASCWRSEEHTSELQSRLHLVCRLLLEKKKKQSHNKY